MRHFIGTVRRASARLLQMLSNDPLLHPLGRASDTSIDQALAARGLGRADLFTVGTTLAPHRYRLAAMLAAYRLSTRKVVTDHWQELKKADNRCAFCDNVGRCERWLRWGRENDAPRTFCPNATTLEQMKTTSASHLE